MWPASFPVTACEERQTERERERERGFENVTICLSAAALVCCCAMHLSCALPIKNTDALAAAVRGLPGGESVPCRGVREGANVGTGPERWHRPKS